MNISLGIAEGPGVARGKKYIKINYEEKKILLIFVRPPGLPMSVHKNFSPLGPTVWPTIQSEHIYERLVLLHGFTEKEFLNYFSFFFTCQR